MRRLLDIAPLVALLGVWALGGLASALVLVGQALRRAWRGAGQL
jgi:hypothetical protein